MNLLLGKRNIRIDLKAIHDLMQESISSLGSGCTLVKNATCGAAKAVCVQTTTRDSKSTSLSPLAFISRYISHAHSSMLGPRDAIYAELDSLNADLDPLEISVEYSNISRIAMSIGSSIDVASSRAHDKEKITLVLVCLEQSQSRCIA